MKTIFFVVLSFIPQTASANSRVDYSPRHMVSCAQKSERYVAWTRRFQVVAETAEYVDVQWIQNHGYCADYTITRVLPVENANYLVTSWKSRPFSWPGEKLITPHEVLSLSVVSDGYLREGSSAYTMIRLWKARFRKPVEEIRTNFWPNLNRNGGFENILRAELSADGSIAVQLR